MSSPPAHATTGRGVHVRFVRCPQAAFAARRSQESSKRPLSRQPQGDDGFGASEGPAHAGALESCADLLASGLDDARGDAQVSGAELRIAHPVVVPEYIVLELAQFRAQVKAFAAAGAVSARSSPDRPATAGWR